MKWLRRLSIYFKINGIILVMLLLISLFMGFIMTKTATHLIEDQMEKRGAELASYLGVLSSNDILLDDHYALFDRVNKTKQNTDDVRYIIISDSAGRVLAHTFENSLPKGLPAGVTMQPPVLLSSDTNSAISSYQVTKYNSNEGLIREIVMPIENGAIGYVRVGMSEKGTEQIMNKRMKDFIVLIFLVGVFAAAGATYLAFVIISPLRSLTQAAEQIRRGNFQVYADIPHQDEVGQLSKVFNDMAQSLREKQLENNRLLEDLRTKEVLRAELIKKLFSVQEEERKRLSRELHDETGQLLASLLAYMKLLLSKLVEEEQKQVLFAARNVAMDALGGLRKIAVELRPPVLDDLGLPAAMKRYIQTFSEQQGLAVHFSVLEDNVVIGSEVSLALYRILQESLTNIAKHAQASQVYVTLDVSENQVTMVIKDDGLGIGTRTVQSAYYKNRVGIYGMRERAEMLGGSLSIESGKEGGTTVVVILPKFLG
ncbi:HAMP domain-containing sensor histidine kinase [Sporomusa malonica]|uniref:histidine kinase n=1 Tax=Sporomusa malonica TaxID=112901 RepID=A0A1W2C507_9FIRM|nr:ATP-binding protein [Sporomusa malonica]SMC80240.1 Signal transduction histidine kinase [Sporomusa malonica]